MMSCRFLLLCLLVSVVALNSFSLAAEEKYPDNSLQRVIGALHSSIDYFNSTIKETNSLNLNFILAETLGQLRSTVEGLDDLEVSEDEKLKAIKKQIEEEINHVQMMLEVSLKDVNSFKDSAELAQLFNPEIWEFYFPNIMINNSLLSPLTDDDNSFARDYSDDCLTSLFGTGKYSSKCTITLECLKMASEVNYNNYSLTHQLLYFIIGHRMVCWGKMNEIAKQNNLPGPKQQVQIKCANIFKESQEIAKNNFPLNEGEIFLQQSLFCGLLGFEEFYSFDWLQVILKWQQSSGCYSNSLEGDCSSHFTLLAIGTLGQYIRYIVDEEVMSVTNGVPN